MKQLLRIVLVEVVGLTIGVALGYGILLASRPARTDHQEVLFQGVSYFRQARLSPRPLMVHIVEVDLSAPGVDFLVTPGDKSSEMELFASTTSAFLRRFDLQMAINGSFFEPFYSKNFTPWGYYPHSGDPINVNGLAISNSEMYSESEISHPVLCVTTNRILITRKSCPMDTVQALAGNEIIIDNSAPFPHAHNPYFESTHPRTAVALDAEGRTLWLVVVDGRQRGYSEGVTLNELAEIILELGAKTALNLDGGGSSTLVVAGRWKSRVLNAPIHRRIPGYQRPVANHLGIYALPIETSETK